MFDLFIFLTGFFFILSILNVSKAVTNTSTYFHEFLLSVLRKTQQYNEFKINLIRSKVNRGEYLYMSIEEFEKFLDDNIVTHEDILHLSDHLSLRNIFYCSLYKVRPEEYFCRILPKLDNVIRY